MKYKNDVPTSLFMHLKRHIFQLRAYKNDPLLRYRYKTLNSKATKIKNHKQKRQLKSIRSIYYSDQYSPNRNLLYSKNGERSFAPICAIVHSSFTYYLRKQLKTGINVPKRYMPYCDRLYTYRNHTSPVYKF